MLTQGTPSRKTFLAFTACIAVVFSGITHRVDSHVIIQASVSIKRLVTHVTFVQSITTVNCAVREQITRVRKSFSTVGTFERLLSGMNSLVSPEVVGVTTAFAALGALVFTHMNIHVPSQLSRRWETFPAVLTRVRSLFSVRSAVHNKVARRRKSFATHGAFKLPRVTSHVLCKTATTSTEFATFRAHVFTAGMPVFSGMWFSVFCQLTAVITAFVALRALVFIRVNIHVPNQLPQGRIASLAVRTRIWFHSAVNPAVQNKVAWSRETMVTDAAFKRFLSWMTSTVFPEVSRTWITFAAIRALVFTGVNIHMLTQGFIRRKTFITLHTPDFARMWFSVIFHRPFGSKPFVALKTHIRLVTVSDVVAISFSLQLRWAFTCTVCTTQDTVNDKHSVTWFHNHVSRSAYTMPLCSVCLPCTSSKTDTRLMDSFPGNLDNLVQESLNGSGF